MRRLLCTMVVFSGIVSGFWFSAAALETISVETMPPVVVSTFPASGDTGVDPSIREIRVTFSKDMATEKMWSWVMASKESFPELTGEVRYLDDKRTCVAPVKLLPGKDYAVWFNTGGYDSFRDEGNRPAVPYLLAFRTRQ